MPCRCFGVWLFFSSRRRHTRLQGDWSSDVCSSDLVANGVFTTCQCGGLEAPSWSIAGRRTDITLQGKGIVRHMTFLVKDVPVFYFPYFVFPANTPRETGFLNPRPGPPNRAGLRDRH